MKYRGIITPMITPFNSEGQIDFDATGTLIEYIKSIGVSGLFPCGSTGLFTFLSKEERKDFLKFVIENANGLKVLAGVGSSSTQEAIELGKFAAEAGADALVLMPTYYITPGQNEIKKHFSEFISSVKKDTFIYNIPQLCGARIELDTVKELKEKHPEIIGIKESSADMRYFSQLMKFTGPEFSILQGQDDLLVPSLSIGADGGVCGLSNFSSSVVNAYNEYDMGSRSKGSEIQVKQVDPLIHSLLGTTFPSAYYYAFYNKFGLKDGGYRTPMLEPSKSEKERIARALNPE